MAHLGQDVAGAMATRDQLLAIATEPDLDGNGKLFAFCLLAYLHERRRAGLRTADWIEEVGARMHPTTARPRPIMDPTHLVHRAIANDVPRYEIPRISITALRCIAPKTRGPHAGQPCGNQACGQPKLDHDPDTGAQRWIGYCRNHTHPSLDRWREHRYQQWIDNGKPSPPPTRGGILAKHFPTGHWSHYYAWASRYLIPEPTEQAREHPRPALTVITGGAVSGAFDDEHHDGATLAVLR